MRVKLYIAILLIAPAACGPERQPQQKADNAVAPTLPAPSAPPAVKNSEAPSPAPATAEPKGAIDPKSVEAAAQIVQHYGALIEQGRWAEAEELWGHPSTARQFTSDLKRNVREVHLEIGKPGDMEGAAGSIYVTVPVTFYGKDNDGKAFRHQAGIVVRRVNDVPGSTAAQRAWHIDGIQGEDTGAN